MKKLITLLGTIWLMWGAVFAQNCHFKVRFDSIPASCYNNAKVLYALEDANGNIVSSAADINLEQVRIYYKVNEGDSANYSTYYSGGWDTMTIDYGTYIIGVEGACSDGNGGWIKVDTHKVMNIPTTYTTPTFESFYNMAADTLAYGNRPSLDCINTGRVQLVIKDGKFPYYVTIMDYTTGDTLRTDTFQTRQYSGTTQSRYNYKDYYSIDNLPPGNWVFAFVDGCEYGHPYHTHEVEPVEEPELVSISSSSHSGEYVDSLSKRYISVTVNIDNLAHQFTNTSIKKKYWHNLAYMPQIAEYRINYGEPLGVSEWRPMPSKTYYDYNNSYCYITLYDTLLAKMCKENWSQLLGRPLTLEWRDKCRDTIIYRNFTFSNPSVSYYSSSQTDSTINYPESSNGCVRTTSYYKTYSHTRVHYIYAYNINGKFAHNGVWIWKDLNTGSIIKRDTIAYVSSTSRLYDYEVEELYDWDRKTNLTLNVERVLVSDECDTLFKSTGTITFRADSSQTNSSSNISNWYWYRNDASCISGRRSITLYGNYYNLSDIDLDSTTIRLVSSPYGNRYNFEAIYSSATKTWEITKSSLDNTATISGGNDGTSLSISDYGLPNGNYNFIVITPCDTYTFNPNVQFSNMLDIEMVEDPEYTIEEECILSYITYTKGRFERHYYQTSPQPDQDYVFLPNKTTTATTFIQIIDGPLGGYDNEVHQLNEPIRISMPGRFIVSIRPYSYHYSGGSKYGDCDKYVSSSYCYCNYYDTIYYERNTVEFEYDYAMLCDSNSTHGNVYVKGINGREPYVYTLYDGPDKTGNIIGTNSTGFFEDVPMTHNDVISCMVRDSCGAYFHVNIHPETWTDLQKVWFDNGLTVSTTCEGSTVCVNALSIGSILSYEWSGPNGFTDTESRSCVFIPRGADEGWYKVHIYNTGCTADYVDSIYLNIDRAPSVELADDFTVCPGAPAVLEFFPSSPNPTDEFTLKIVLETESGKTTQTLTVPAGDTARYTINPLTRTKVYVSSVYDGHCDYTIVEDTQFVDVYTINPYTVTTTHDTVCWETTANLSAVSSLTPPYAIRWYKDYNLTQLVQEDSIFSVDEISSRVLPNMVRDSIFYIMVENNEYCPTTYGMPQHTLNMNDGSTQISLGNTYRFYDSGGPNSNYSNGEHLTHTFSSIDGKPVTIKLESFYFSSSSHLYIFSGTEANSDSLLYDFTYGSSNPGTITSRGGALTCYFVAGNSSNTGWKALVEHEPAKAIAKVRPKNTITYYDTVCQSQTHTYTDSYHISPDITSLESLNNALRVHGTHTFSNVLEGAGLYGCDSTVNFYLTVTTPPRHDTTVVITNMHHTGYTWHDSLYTQSGSHIHYIPLEGGCDFMDILYLVVLDIDTLSDDICLGDSTDLIITVKKREIQSSNNVIPRNPRLGDVLCTDGSTMHPDSFLISNKTAMGVVLSVDAETGYGRAIALSNAYSSKLRWAYNYYSSSHSLSAKTTYAQAILDMNGAGNTNEILRTTKNAGGTNTASYAPAAHYCKFYNHNTYTIGTDSLGWYLPAAGEMQLIYGNRVELNKTLTKLRTQSTKNTLLTNDSYWTSTEYNNSYAWYLYYTGYLYYYGSKTTNYYARPVIQFPLP